MTTTNDGQTEAVELQRLLTGWAMPPEDAKAFREWEVRDQQLEVQMLATHPDTVKRGVQEARDVFAKSADPGDYSKLQKIEDAAAIKLQSCRQNLTLLSDAQLENVRRLVPVVQRLHPEVVAVAGKVYAKERAITEQRCGAFGLAYREGPVESAITAAIDELTLALEKILADPNPERLRVWLATVGLSVT